MSKDKRVESKSERSKLIDKAQSLGLSLPMDLEGLAVARGCDYYEGAPSRLGDVPLSNLEVAVLLVLPEFNPSPRDIRLAAALLGSPGILAQEVASLALQEKCGDVIKHIAQSGTRFEPENRFWRELVELLANIEVDSDALPHPSRFVEMTGMDRGSVGVRTRWIRPRRPIAA